jgi:hypothetical protein
LEAANSMPDSCAQVGNMEGWEIGD